MITGQHTPFVFLLKYLTVVVSSTVRKTAH